MTMFEYYLLFVLLPNLSGFFMGTFITLLILTGLSVFAYGVCENAEDKTKIGKSSNTFVLLVLIVGFLGCFVPSREKINAYVDVYLTSGENNINNLSKNSIQFLNARLNRRS